jgi:TetR/AcrR family transcriptional repressor of nem operon
VRAKEISKADKTRQFIIERTAPIFNRKGFAGTSLTDITDATGLTKGSIYGNFQGKDEVAEAVFDYNFQTVSGIFRSEMGKCDSIRDKLLVYVYVYENFSKFPFPPGGCPIQNTAIEADDTHPVLKARAAAAIQSWKAQIVSLLEEGLRRIEFRSCPDPEQVALTIIAMIEGCTMISRLSGKTHEKGAIMRSAEKFIRDLH